jgi:hypothetical protein
MSTQSLARANAELLSEENYQALLALLSATARGRAFLEEHARQSRHADIGVLVDAVARIEAQIAAQPSRADLLAEFAALAENVRALRSQIDTVQLTEAVTKLAATLDGAQQRLSAASPAAPAPATPLPAETKLAPEPKAVQAPFALALTAVAAQALAAAEPEEDPVKVFKAGTIPPPPPFAGDDFGDADLEVATSGDEAASTPRGTDPMQQIMALSEEERIALFT